MKRAVTDKVLPSFLKWNEFTDYFFYSGSLKNLFDNAFINHIVVYHIILFLNLWQEDAFTIGPNISFATTIQKNRHEQNQMKAHRIQLINL